MPINPQRLMKFQDVAKRTLAAQSAAEKHALDTGDTSRLDAVEPVLDRLTVLGERFAREAQDGGNMSPGEAEFMLPDNVAARREQDMRDTAVPGGFTMPVMADVPQQAPLPPNLPSLQKSLASNRDRAAGLLDEMFSPGLLTPEDETLALEEAKRVLSRVGNPANPATPGDIKNAWAALAPLLDPSKRLLVEVGDERGTGVGKLQELSRLGEVLARDAGQALPPATAADPQALGPLPPPQQTSYVEDVTPPPTPEDPRIAELQAQVTRLQGQLDAAPEGSFESEMASRLKALGLDKDPSPLGDPLNILSTILNALAFGPATVFNRHQQNQQIRQGQRVAVGQGLMQERAGDRRFLQRAALQSQLGTASRGLADLKDQRAEARQLYAMDLGAIDKELDIIGQTLLLPQRQDAATQKTLMEQQRLLLEARRKLVERSKTNVSVRGGADQATIIEARARLLAP